MFCGHCGKEVTVGAKFCPNCGAAIESQPTLTGEQPKAPAVEQAGNPIKKPIAGNGQSGKGKKGVPKPLIIVAVVLVLFIGFGAILNLFGDSNKPNSDLSESQTTQESVVPYREFNGEEFLSGSYVPGGITYHDKDASQTHVVLGNALLGVYEKGSFKKLSDRIAKDGVTWKTVKQCLEDDWFNFETESVELEYINKVQWNEKSYDYFRLNVHDLDGLNSRFELSPDWISPEEIYLIAEAYVVGNSSTGEFGIKIQYYIKQFDEKMNSTPGQTNQSTGDTTIHNTGTTLVETDYYTVEIPMEWEKYCTYEETSKIGEHRLTFYIKNEYMEGGYDGTLLDLAAVENPENLDSELYTYECQICEYRTVLFDLMRRTPEDIQVKKQYQELLISVQEFVPYVVQSIKEKDGYTLSYDLPNVNSSVGTHFLQVNDSAILSGSFVDERGEIISFFPTSMGLYSSDVDLMWNEKRVCHLSYQEYQNTSDADVFVAYNRQPALEDEMTVEYWKDDDRVVITGSKQFDGEYDRHYEGVYRIPFSSVKTNMVGDNLQTDKYQNSYKFDFFHIGMNRQDFNWYSRYQDQEIVATDSSGNVVLRYLTVSQSLDFGDRFITVSEFDPPSVEPLIIEGELIPSCLIYECENAYIVLVTSHSGDGNYLTDYVRTATYVSNTDFYVTY